MIISIKVDITHILLKAHILLKEGKIMIWPFLFVLLFVIFAWKSIYRESCDFLDYFFDTLFLGLMSILVFALGIGFSLLIGLAGSKQWIGPETAKLVSLRGNDGISGSFFLGIGSIGTTQYYFFYKEAEGGYQPGKVKIVNNVMVFEEKRQDAQVKIYTYRFTKPWLKWFAECWPSRKYEFVVPEGSIKKDFVL